MKIEVNEKPIEVADSINIRELLEHLAIPHKGRAVAIDNVVIPRSAWEQRTIAENERIIIIQAVSGG